MTGELESAHRELEQVLIRSGCIAAGSKAQWTALGGGVSSDVWRVDTLKGALCVKQACARLKVAAEWLAPLSRSSNEWRYLKFAQRTLPGSVPRPLAHDESRSV